MNEINEYTKIGFDGFVKVSDLRNTNSAIPSAEGVYIVVRRDEKGPEFLAVGTGGHFKGKNPNVAIEILKDKVVKGSQVMYNRQGYQPSETYQSTSKIRCWGECGPLGRQVFVATV